MVSKIFITGVTGYIGGDILSQLAPRFPDLKISALVRSADKGNAVTDKHPSVRLVHGSLDDSALLEKEAADADVVIHAADASDHVGAASAISKGLQKGHTREKPGYWLHTGGTGILTYFDSSAKSFGEPTSKVFDDFDGVDELTHLPAEAFHRNVDEIVLNTGIDHADTVKTAIICPPTIYGPGRGPVSGRSRQVYELTSFILAQSYVPQIGSGLSTWNNVHVHDLSELYLLLAQLALSGDTSSDLWGAKGYYLAENGEHVWGETAKFIGQESAKQGLVDKDVQMKELNFDEAVKSPAGFEAASWGMNSRGKAVRGRKLLGWTPKAPSLEEEVPGIVKAEAKRLGR